MNSAASKAAPRVFDPFAAGSDAYLVPKPELESMVVDVFRRFDLVEEDTGNSGAKGTSCKIPAEALTRFMRELCSMYNDSLDFHNFHHAFTVFTVSAEIVRAVLDAASDGNGDGGDGRHGSTQALPQLQPIHVLAILLAALCHDVDHPGLSNAFLNSTRPAQEAEDTPKSSSAPRPHPLAARFGDETASVVEAHHVEITTQLLHTNDRTVLNATGGQGETVEKVEKTAESPANKLSTGGLLSSMDEADAAYAMKLIRHAIMGTDLAVHKGLTQKLETVGQMLRGTTPEQVPGSAEGVGAGKEGVEGLSLEQTPAETLDEATLGERMKAAVGEDFHHVVIQAILHAADLSNPALHFDSCTAWSLRLSAEFAGAATREAAWKNNATTAAGTTTGAPDDGAGVGGGANSRSKDVPASAAAREANRGVVADTAELRKRLLPVAKGEVWFVGNVILPYWKAIAEVYPPLQWHVGRVQETLETYKAIAAEHEASSS